MTWSNPVLGGDNTLIRTSIHSPDYVAGTSGWTINKDGSAEFNNVNVRGDLDVVGTDGSRVGISANAGTAIIDVQPPNFANPAIQLSIPPRIYAFKDDVASHAGLALESGNFVSGHSGYLYVISETYPGNNDASLLWTKNATINGTLTVGNGCTVTGDLSVTGNISGTVVGAGQWVAGAHFTGDNAGVTSSTEVVQLTAVDSTGSQPTFQPGYVYRIEVETEVQTTAVATAPNFAIRKTNTTGTRFRFYRAGPSVANFPYGVSFRGYFKVSGSPVTASIVLTLSGAAGQTVTMRTTTDGVSAMNIYNDGPLVGGRATNYPVLS